LITFDGKKHQKWITWRSPTQKGKVTIHYNNDWKTSRLTVSADFKYLKDSRWIQSESTPSYWELKHPSVEDIIATLAELGEQ
jgi:hypothetical protein